MRSIRLLAATTIIVLGVAACGDDGNGPENQAPDASFSQVCTELSCVFTDGSTDSDGTIASRSWSFESGTPPSSVEASQTVTFPAAGTYTVTLTVTDNEGASDDVSQEITVTAGTANTTPTASFTAPACTVNVPCLFSDGPSTDSDGTVTAWSWNFGDGTAPAAEQNPTHTFATVGAYQVTLTVTDDDGATNSITQPVTVSTPTSQACVPDPSNSEWVNCTLDITSNASLTVTLTSNDCELGGNQFHVREPFAARQVLFFNGCSAAEGTQYLVDDATGAPIQFAAGTQVQLQFRQGDPDAGDPAVGAPAARIEGTFPTWTLRIDDGGNPTGPGEPDFADLVLTIQAS